MVQKETPPVGAGHQIIKPNYCDMNKATLVYVVDFKRFHFWVLFYDAAILLQKS